MSLTLNLLQVQGFIINIKKSSLILSTQITHLGVNIDTLIARIYPSSEKYQKIQDLLALFWNGKRPTITLNLQLLGLLLSCMRFTPWAQSHISWLHLKGVGLLPRMHRSSREGSSKADQLLTGWPVQGKVCKAMTSRSLILSTDTSLEGWGAYIGS